MIEINIPGRGSCQIRNIVFDYNGTLATDGDISDKTKKLLLRIKELVNIYIVTADTHGTVNQKCEGLGVTIRTFPQGDAAMFKKSIVEELGAANTLCIGNGYNDIEMFKISALSIAIMDKEGCSGKLIGVADIVVASIADALDIIQNPKRITATLRG